MSNASKRVANPQTIEYSISSTQPAFKSSQENDSYLNIEQRRAFLRLPLEERRCILEQQAENMVNHYQQNLEWQEFLAGDIIEY